MPRSSTSAVALAANFRDISLTIDYRSPDDLTPGSNQVRKHTLRQLKRIASSIAIHGFITPIIIHPDGVIAAGNARVQAAKSLGITRVPVIAVDHLTAEQLRLYALADNKLAEEASWDIDALRAEFADIALSAPQLDQDSSGFTIAERDIVYGRHRANELNDLDDAPEPSAGPTITRLGDRWMLGDHVVGCGDATDPEVIASVVGGRQVRVVASDLPYNVKIANNVSGLGKNQHADFAMASGEMSEEQFTAFLHSALEAALPHLTDGALLYLFMDWRHIWELQNAARQAKLAQLNLLVWAKTNAGMGSFYRSAHELVCVFKYGEGRHLNNVELGRFGRNRTNVLHYPGVNTFGKGRKKALELHPTAKPVALMADLLLDSSAPGDVVLDPFGGSGTTLIAAEKTDRIACLLELSPAYVDVTVRRWELMTGREAVLAGSGQTFATIASERLAQEAA